ncbi:Ger(x)C family spore germination protein [Paenibacillus sp. LjRoot153]|uniref:Ger(x)C family spore germination protein n=1 Tax=Paenibacillus sp. LjRoot153 TaxID=3342270 RepID=UPI003F500285
MNMVLVIVSIFLTGCWSHYELTDLVFVMGLAIDTKQDGTVQITTQYYKPKGGKINSQDIGTTSFNVISTGDSVLPAIRKITGELGRRSQWSHMRVILISEDTARRTNVGDLLDIFYRDPEPRLTASIMITKGTAQSYLEKKPTLEQTTSQQIMRSKKALYKYSARTVDSNLLDLGKQLKDKTGNAVIAYVIPNQEKGFKVSGSALFKKDRMVDKLTGDENDGYLMLTNRYNYGLVEVPCGNSAENKQKNEIVEVTAFSSNLKYQFVKDKLVVSVKATAKGSARELKCTAFDSVDAETAFVKKTEEIIVDRMKRTFEDLQKKKLDIFLIGNRVYQNNETLWNKIEPEWENYFSHASFDARVTLNLENTGTSAGKPVFSK